MVFNKIFIMGKVGRDPQLKLTDEGEHICYLAVSTEETIKEQNVITWYQVILLGNQAKKAKISLNKGSNVFVEGRLRLQQMKDKQGNPHNVLEISANNFYSLNSL